MFTKFCTDTRKMPRQGRGKAEVHQPPLPSHCGAEAHAEVEFHVFFLTKSIVGPAKAQVRCKKIPFRGILLGCRCWICHLSCYAGCSEKWKFGGHNSFHPKAVVQSRLNETSLELGDRKDTWLWGSQQEWGSSSILEFTRAERS